jgi:hypothetical protein
MKRLVSLAGLAALTCGCTHAAPLQTSLDEISLSWPQTPDCATDFQERGLHSEQPLSRESYLVATLNSDLNGGIEGLGAREPLCFYLLPNESLLMRDGRGIMYLFRKYTKWDRYRTPDSPLTN